MHTSQPGDGFASDHRSYISRPSHAVKLSSKASGGLQCRWERRFAAQAFPHSEQQLLDQKAAESTADGSTQSNRDQGIESCDRKPQ